MTINYIGTVPPRNSTYLPVLEPEALAACLARYSRSNLGIDKIIEDSKGRDASSILRMIDYGHASIGGLTGSLAFTLDGISILLAYKVFQAAQMADGQESSTRYIQLNQDGLQNITYLGLPSQISDLWTKTCLEGFELYKTIIHTLEQEVKINPPNLPERALNNSKIKARMLRNYALDRARYFLPVAAKTNLALVASARIWADVIKQIDSLQWPEATLVAAMLREKLTTICPNLAKHSLPDQASILAAKSHLVKKLPKPRILTQEATCRCRVHILNPPSSFQKLGKFLSSAFQYKTDRYSHTTPIIKRIATQTQWSAIAIAELRDLNRHRTGFRFSTLQPKGFYIPKEVKFIAQDKQKAFFESYKHTLLALEKEAPDLLPYGFFLGTQVPFEHTQQLDKLIYQIELRTGLGAHFRYAQHLFQAAEALLRELPSLEAHIELGSAEPE